MKHKNTLVVYGIEINTDILFPLKFFKESKIRYHLSFSLLKSIDIKRKLCCGFPLYVSHGREVYLYSDREFDGSTKGQPWCYEVKNIVKFYWGSETETIFYEMGREGDIHLLSFWFIHLFLPLYMTMEKKYHFFHGGAISIENKPILFLAPSMGGKSTLTDYFLQQGHALISDDKIATFYENDKLNVVLSHSYHRPYRKFEELGLYVDKVCKTFNPIHAFYLLDRVAADASIEIIEVTGRQKFIELLPHYLYRFSWLKQEQFEYISKIGNEKSIFRISIPYNLERLDEVYEAIYYHSQYKVK